MGSQGNTLMEKRHPVFLSTGYPDPLGVRQKVLAPLLNQALMPLGMAALDDGADHMPLAQRLIDDSDYVVLVLGGLYGALSPLGLSQMHREFVYAATKRKPVLAFIHEAPSLLPEAAREGSREGAVRRDDFARLLQGKTRCHTWREPEDLVERLARVLPDWLRTHPAAGWVRPGTSGGTEDAVLRRRLAALEAERERWLTDQRPAAAALARGGDPVELEYSCAVYQGGACKLARGRSRWQWEAVFGSLAPKMLEGASEAVLRKTLEQALARRALEELKLRFPEAHAVRNVTLAEPVLQQIKVQLRALGLIRHDERGAGPGCWRLTATGDAAMTQLLARRREGG